MESHPNPGPRHEPDRLYERASDPAEAIREWFTGLPESAPESIVFILVFEVRFTFFFAFFAVGAGAVSVAAGSEPDVCACTGRVNVTNVAVRAAAINVFRFDMGSSLQQGWPGGVPGVWTG